MNKAKKEDFQNNSIALLWSHSHIWGFLVLHSLRSLNVPFTLVYADDIEEKGLPEGIKLLIVPGGSARFKAKSLGKKGLEYIRKFVKNGGNYLGFCGGCGLALNTKEGLGLCPWGRSLIQDKLLHHISGHLFVDSEDNSYKPSGFDKSNSMLPVWFPARFAVENVENSPVILARYKKGTPDLYMADLPQSFVEAYNQESIELFGQYLDPRLENEPVAVSGVYGKGKYLISYAHLETPNSPYANAMYANILRDFADIEIITNTVENLDLNSMPVSWENEELKNCNDNFNSIFKLGLEFGLFFERTSWLYGWMHGIQGVQLANLRMYFAFIQSQEPNENMINMWNTIKDDFLSLFNLFCEGAYSWMYARRLCFSLPDTLSSHELSDQQKRLFGEAMKMNGICGQLVEMLEKVFVAGNKN